MTKPTPDPTPAEIRRATEAIREGWDERERERRTVGAANKPVIVEVVRVGE